MEGGDVGRGEEVWRAEVAEGLDYCSFAALG